MKTLPVQSEEYKVLCAVARAAAQIPGFFDAAIARGEDRHGNEEIAIGNLRYELQRLSVLAPNPES